MMRRNLDPQAFLKKFVTCSAVAICGSLSFAANASAYNFIVSNTNIGPGPGTFENALNNAGDDVNFPGHNTITITATGSYDLPINRDLPGIFGDTAIIGPGPANFKFSGQQLQHGQALIRTFGHVSISGVRIEDANIHDQVGGAIKVDAGDLTLDNVVLAGNSSDIGGGGIYNEGTLTVNNSMITGNIGGGEAGGIDNDNGSVTLNNTTVTQNALGILNQSGTTTLNKSIVSNNPGGGLANKFGTTTLNGTTVSGNTSGSGGGGIKVLDGTVNLIGSLVSGNHATSIIGGGGINNRGTLNVTNSTISQNTSEGYGGGIDTFDNTGPATTTLSSATVVGNTANAGINDGFGDSGGLQNGEGNGAVSVTNSLIALNTVLPGDGSHFNCGGFSFASGGHNLRGSADPGCSGFTGTGDATNNALAPTIGSLAANGGPTKTIALLAGSPAINTGGGCPATDQRGYIRTPVAPCDIGAFEFGALPPPPPPGIPPPQGGGTQSTGQRAAALKKCKKKHPHKKRKKCRRRAQKLPA